MTNEILDLNILRNQKQKLLDKWLAILKSNPDFTKKHEVLHDAESFLDKLVLSVGTIEVPKINVQEFKPILEILDEFYQTHIQEGYSEKDVATYIFTLKNSFLELFADQEKESKTLNDFNRLLDILGLLSFESYAKSREKLLAKQQEEILYLREENMRIQHYGNIIGESLPMKQVLMSINQVLTNDVTVLLTGATGTGKEVVAQTIHQHSNRKDKPFVVVNCSAIPDNLLESELFGFERGAFTGALERRTGKFEVASGGTIFLDEIGEMSKPLQAKLLRVLQEKIVERIGGHEQISIDVRFICATNKELTEEVARGNFREDLFYRINVFPIPLPLLKDRGYDIILLADFFMKEISKKFKKNVQGFTPEAEHALLNYDWPGNVRELENVISRALIICRTNKIDTPDLTITKFISQKEPIQISHTGYEIRSLEDSEKIVIQNMLKEKKGNIRQAALALNISRTTLYRKMKEYKLV